MTQQDDLVRPLVQQHLADFSLEHGAHFGSRFGCDVDALVLFDDAFDRSVRVESVVIYDDSPHRVGQLAGILFELSGELDVEFPLFGRLRFRFVFARFFGDDLPYLFLHLFDPLPVRLDDRVQFARFLLQFLRRGAVLRFVLVQRGQLFVAAAAHFVEFLLLTLQAGYFASDRGRYRIDFGGFLFPHPVVAVHIGDPQRSVVEIPRCEQKEHEVVQLVILIGIVNHRGVFLPQPIQILFQRPDRRVFRTDVVFDQSRLFFEVRDDVLPVADPLSRLLQNL